MQMGDFITVGRIIDLARIESGVKRLGGLCQILSEQFKVITVEQEQFTDVVIESNDAAPLMGLLSGSMQEVLED